jgi:hypothetical protein
VSLFDSTKICTVLNSILQNTPNLNKLKIVTLYRNFWQRAVTEFQQQENWCILLIWRHMAWRYRLRVVCSPFNLLMCLLAREYFTEHSKLSAKNCIWRQILAWSMTTRCEVTRTRNRRNSHYGMCGPGSWTKLKRRATLPTPGLVLQYKTVILDFSFNTGIRKPKRAC